MTALDLDAIRARTFSVTYPDLQALLQDDIPALIKEVERMRVLVDLWVPKLTYIGTGTTATTSSGTRPTGSES